MAKEVLLGACFRDSVSHSGEIHIEVDSDGNLSEVPAVSSNVHSRKNG